MGTSLPHETAHFIVEWPKWLESGQLTLGWNLSAWQVLPLVLVHRACLLPLPPCQPFKLLKMAIMDLLSFLFPRVISQVLSSASCDVAWELLSYWVTPSLSATVLWRVSQIKKYVAWLVQVYGTDVCLNWIDYLTLWSGNDPFILCNQTIAFACFKILLYLSLY